MISIIYTIVVGAVLGLAVICKTITIADVKATPTPTPTPIVAPVSPDYDKG